MDEKTRAWPTAGGVTYDVVGQTYGTIENLHHDPETGYTWPAPPPPTPEEVFRSDLLASLSRIEALLTKLVEKG